MSDLFAEGPLGVRDERRRCPLPDELEHEARERTDRSGLVAAFVRPRGGEHLADLRSDAIDGQIDRVGPVVPMNDFGDAALSFDGERSPGARLAR